MKSIWINSFIGMIILATSLFSTSAFAARPGSIEMRKCHSGEIGLLRTTELGELVRINSCAIYTSGGENRIVLLGVFETSENLELILVIGRNAIDRSGDEVLFSYTFETKLKVDDPAPDEVPKYRLNFISAGRNSQTLDLSHFVFTVDPGAKSEMSERYVLRRTYDSRQRRPINLYVLDRSSN